MTLNEILGELTSLRNNENKVVVDRVRAEIEELFKYSSQVIPVDPRDSQRSMIDVIPSGDGKWNVEIRSDKPKESKPFNDKAEALSYAKTLANKSPLNKVVVHRPDGIYEIEYTDGRDAHPHVEYTDGRDVHPRVG